MAMSQTFAEQCQKNRIFPLEGGETKAENKWGKIEPYLFVKPLECSRYDVILTVCDTQYYVIRHPLALHRPYEEFILALFKRFKDDRNRITFNENPSYITSGDWQLYSPAYEGNTNPKRFINRYVRFYLDIDFSKAELEVDKDRWLTLIIEYVAKLIGFYKTDILFNKNGNVHIYWDVCMRISNIKAIHWLIQEFMKLQYKGFNITEVIDSSDGLRLPFCYKQKKVIFDEPVKVDTDFKAMLEEESNIKPETFEKTKKKKMKTSYTFEENYYYDVDDLAWNDLAAISKRMAKFSLYKEDLPKWKPAWDHKEISIASLYIHRFDIELDEGHKREICEYYNITKNQDQWLKANGWIKPSLTRKKELKELESPILYGTTINILGKDVIIDLSFFRSILSMINPKRVNSGRPWYYLLRIVKALAHGTNKIEQPKVPFYEDEKPLPLKEQIYQVWDEWCAKADRGYNKDNNRLKWSKLKKVSVNFQDFIDMAHPGKLSELLGLFPFKTAEYYASKMMIDPRMECYDETVGTIKGCTRQLDELPGIEVVSANMGCGKTEVCSSFCKKMIAQGKSILMITTRINLARDLKKRNPDFTCYLDKDLKAYQLQNTDHLIIQAESIHKLCRTYDILILDETHELCNQFLSPLHRSHVQTLATLSRLIKGCSMIKCLEAFVTPFVWEFLDIFKGDKDIRASRNTHQKRTDYNCVFIEGKHSALENRIGAAIQAKKKIFIACNSTLLAKKTNQFCLDQGVPACFIWAQCSEKKKSQIITDQSILEDCLVFIYTPTITVGVNIENLKKPFDEGFCYFNNNCNDVNSCMQMTNRIRVLTDKKLTFLIECFGRKMPVMHKTIDELLKKRTSIFQDTFNDLYFYKEANQDTHAKDENDPWFRYTRAYVINKHRSHNDFYAYLLFYIQQTGCQITHESEIDESPSVMVEAKVKIEDNELLELQGVELIDEDKYKNLKQSTSLSRKGILEMEVYEQVSILGSVINDAKELKFFRKNRSVFENMGALKDAQRIRQYINADRFNAQLAKKAKRIEKQADKIRTKRDKTRKTLFHNLEEALSNVKNESIEWKIFCDALSKMISTSVHTFDDISKVAKAILYVKVMNRFDPNFAYFNELKNALIAFDDFDKMVKANSLPKAPWSERKEYPKPTPFIMQVDYDYDSVFSNMIEVSRFNKWFNGIQLMHTIFGGPLTFTNLANFIAHKNEIMANVKELAAEEKWCILYGKLPSVSSQQSCIKWLNKIFQPLFGLKVVTMFSITKKKTTATQDRYGLKISKAMAPYVEKYDIV